MCLPHVVLDDMLPLTFDCRLLSTGQTSICQVLELILGVARIVILGCEPDIWLLPHPNSQGLHACDENPYANVELFT